MTCALLLAIIPRLLRETVWNFAMSPESGLRKRPRWVEGVPIGCFLAPKKRAPDAFSYFPNSLRR
jgi:hypothetical protein